MNLAKIKAYLNAGEHYSFAKFCEELPQTINRGRLSLSKVGKLKWKIKEYNNENGGYDFKGYLIMENATGASPVFVVNKYWKEEE